MATIAALPLASMTPGETSEPPSKEMAPEEVRNAIAERAYFKAEKRGFAPGGEEADWLEAEQEVKTLSEYWLP